jgi:hypothetical protein
MRARRHFNPESRFYRSTETDRIGNRAVAGYASRKLGAFMQVGARDQAFDPLMYIAEAFLEPHNCLAIGRETKMARFDDPGMDRTYGDLMQAFAFDGQKHITARFGIRNLGSKWKSHAPSIVIEPLPLVGKSDWTDTPQIMQSALKP